MQYELLFAFVVVFTLDSVTPGPAVAMVMSRGASIGLIRTLPFIAGLVLGDLLLFGVALAGLATLAATLGPLFAIALQVDDSIRPVHHPRHSDRPETDPT